MHQSVLVAGIDLKNVGRLVEQIEDIAVNVIPKVGKKAHAVCGMILMILKNAKTFNQNPLNTLVIILAS